MVRLSLEQVFGARYVYCSPDSPELKLIENVFALEKQSFAIEMLLLLVTNSSLHVPAPLPQNAK